MSDIDWSEAPDGAEVYSDKSVQWNKQSVYSTARPAAYDGTTLPPVGTVCGVALNGSGQNKSVIEVLYCDESTVVGRIISGVFAYAFSNGFPTSEYRFTPIKTERERVIDEISAAYFEGARGHMGGIAGIYEAGFRKVQ